MQTNVQRDFFEKLSYPYTSSVSQNIQGTHSHMDASPPRPALTEPGGDSAHTQQFSDYLYLVQVGNGCDESRHVSAQMQFCDRSGKERDNPFCHHAKRGGRMHTGKKRKLEIAEGVVNMPSTTFSRPILTQFSFLKPTWKERNW